MATPEEARRLAVFIADQAEADAQNASLRLMRLMGPEYAARWLSDLQRTLHELPDFPGPRAHAIDEEASARYGYEVRRLLYYSPQLRQQRRGSRAPSRRGTPYRVLYTILPPAPDEDEGIIRILRVLHGAQQTGDGDSAQAEDAGEGGTL